MGGLFHGMAGSSLFEFILILIALKHFVFYPTGLSSFPFYLLGIGIVAIIIITLAKVCAAIWGDTMPWHGLLPCFIWICTKKQSFLSIFQTVWHWHSCHHYQLFAKVCTALVRDTMPPPLPLNSFAIVIPSIDSAKYLMHHFLFNKHSNSPIVSNVILQIFYSWICKGGS